MRRLALLVALAACFEPALGDRPYLCGPPPDECPPDYVCDGTFCVRSLGDGGARADAPPGTPDARRFDARPQPDARPGTPDAPPCQPTDVIGCDGNTALLCDGSQRDCAFRCDPDARLCEQCDPAQPSFCLGDTVATCSPTGQIGAAGQDCLGFCTAADDSARCATLEPSNLPPTMCDTPAAIPRTISAHISINTDECTGGSKIQQSAGPALCLLRYTDLDLTAAGAVAVTGAAALVLVATHDLTVDGTIDVSGRGAAGGPGAPIPPPGAGSSDPSSASSGGGGGGYAEDGGGGGDQSVAGAIPGGPSYGDDSLTPLVGGSPGGGASAGQIPCSSSLVIAAGGGGGGALELVGCHALHIGLIANVFAGGAGGGGGGFSLTCPGGGGGGGGAGGAVLLEAPAVDVGEFASVVAVGGGGGGGGTTGGTIGASGQPGDDGKDAGGGGAGGDAFAGPGGAGSQGAGSALPSAGPGQPPQLPLYGAGGGGGAAGRIRVNTRADAPFDPSGTNIFPRPATGAIASH